MNSDAAEACTNRIAFVSQRDGNYEIYLSSSDGSDQLNLTQSPSVNLSPQWSPDGGRIAYVRDGRLWTMSSDGSRPLQLTAEGAGGPQWSPDGTRIAFLRLDDQDLLTDLWVIDSAGGEEQRLTNVSDTGSFSWSPDGTKIAFTTRRDGDYEIYTMSSDGSAQTNRTNNAADDGVYDAPEWAADGGIVFQSNRSGNLDLWSMGADGSNQRNVTNSSENENKARVAPDGSKIVFERGASSAQDLYSMNPDGTGQLQLTSSGADDGDPVVSTDSTQIAWKRGSGNTSEIYVANLDGSSSQRLTSNEARDEAPVWQPCQ